MQSLRTTLANRTVLILLILIVMLASVLRFYGLGRESFWNDELASWSMSNHNDLSVVIAEASITDIHPPGYHVLLWLVEKYIGDSESLLRFPSALAGVFSVLVIFLIGKQLYSYREGLIASAFMATFWCPVYFSQEARSYSLLLLFVLLVSYFWISLLKKLHETGRLSGYAVFGYILTAAVCSYLHYFGVYLVGLQGLGAMLIFVRKRKTFLYIAMIYFAVLVMYSPWLPSMYKDLSSSVGSWIAPPEGMITTVAGHLHFFFNESGPLTWFVVIMYLFLLVHTWRDILKSKQPGAARALFLSWGMLLVLWLVVPFVGVYVKSKVSAPVLTLRNLIICLPPVYLLLARSLTQLSVSSRVQAIITLAIVGLFLSDLTLRMNYFSRPHKEQFREAVGFVVEHDHHYQHSMIIGYTHGGTEYLDYYFRKKGSHRRVNLIAGQEKDISDTAAAIAAEQPKYLWYVQAHLVPDAQFINFLSQSLKCLAHKKFVGAEVFLFENEYVLKGGANKEGMSGRLTK